MFSIFCSQIQKRLDIFKKNKISKKQKKNTNSKNDHVLKMCGNIEKMLLQLFEIPRNKNFQQSFFSKKILFKIWGN